MKQVNSDFDIVIVGGGIAGIYSAWRLLMTDKADPSKLKKWKKKSKLPNDNKEKNAVEHPRHLLPYKNADMFPRKNKEVGKAPNTKDPWLALKRKNWDHHPAPKRMVEEMHKQIMEMHGVTDAPAPIDAAFKNWGDDPYGAAVHLWNSGYKSWEVMPAITKPVKDFPCYICNEAWSENQTWAEGSLQSSEIVLQKHFGLSEPDWIPKTTK